MKPQVKGTVTLDAVNLSDLENTTFKNTFEITLKTTIAAAASVSPENVTINGYAAANPASSKRLQRRLAQEQAVSGLSVDFVVEFPPVMTTTAELAAMNSTDESSTSITPATNFVRSLKKNELLTDIFAGMAAYGNVTLANVEVELLEIVYFIPPPPPPLPTLLPPPFLPPPPKGTSDGAPILALVGGGVGAVVILLGGVAVVIRSKRRQASITGSGNKAPTLPACHKTQIAPLDDEEQ